MENATTGRKCPNCGATVVEDSKFCSNCGYAFTAIKPPQTVPGEEKSCTKSLQVAKTAKTGFWMRVIPALLFMLFTALTFVFMACPFALDPIFKESVGNVYEMAGDELLGLQDWAVTFVVFACLFLVVGVVYVLSVTVLRREWRFKSELFLYDILLWLTIAIYVLYAVLSIACLILLGDEGYGGSTFCVLILIFSLLFAGGNLVCFILSKKPFAVRLENPKKEVVQSVEPTEPVLLKIQLDAEGDRQIKEYFKKSRISSRLTIFILLPLVAIAWFIFAFSVGDISDVESVRYHVEGDSVNSAAVVVVVSVLCLIVGIIFSSKRVGKKYSENTSNPLYRAVCKSGKKTQVFAIIFAVGVLSIVCVIGGLYLTTYGRIKDIQARGGYRNGYYYRNVWELSQYNKVALPRVIVLLAVFVVTVIFVVVIFALRKSRKKDLRHPSLAMHMGLFTVENMAEMKTYPKRVRRYRHSVKMRGFYLYDKEKYEKYAAENA
ncbi:MAG: zinc ribbon domain-containing protein [Clostridia bacterium]|nr:zinc ribbon domain-containing protein [Clostridia bacterium]